MKKNIFKSMLLLFTAGMTVACSSDNDVVEAPVNPGEVQTPITITANYGDPTTRVGYTEDGTNISATWEEGDQLLVVFNNKVNTLTMTDGAGKKTATFSGTITGTPSATSMLICYVKDKNNPSAATINTDGSYTYADGTFLAQDGTLAEAAKQNLYYGIAQYGDGTNISCNFTTNTSMLKLYVQRPSGAYANASAKLTYKSGDTEIAKAYFIVSEGVSIVYMTVPAGKLSGVQTMVFESGQTEKTTTLSATQANFAAGQTYSKDITFGLVNLSYLSAAYVAQDGDELTGTLQGLFPISIASGATVSLRDVYINKMNNLKSNTDNTKVAGITCLGDATIKIYGDNFVRSLNINMPGIYIPQGNTLTIDGTGTLTACARVNDDTYRYACGIGGGTDLNCGNITIEGGTINAYGGRYYAAIGAGTSSYFNDVVSCGDITIKGGTINADGRGSTAEGTEGGAGIGCGKGNAKDGAKSICGNIAIGWNNPTVSAIGGDGAAGIGCGDELTQCGSIYITTDVTKVDVAKGTGAVNSIGPANANSTCGTVSIGGTFYWNNNAYTAVGQAYLTQSPIIYQPTN